MQTELPEVDRMSSVVLGKLSMRDVWLSMSCGI